MDLSDEEFESVVSSRGFQKMLLYQRLADGIEVLQTHDLLYESMVQAILEQHSEIESADTIEEVLSLLEREVATYTEPLTATGEDDPQLPNTLESAVDSGTSHSGIGGTEPEQAVLEYLESRLEEVNELEIKANEISSEIGLPSPHVGMILGRWRHADDPPLMIRASESSGSVNIWHVMQAGVTEEDAELTEMTSS